MLQTIFRFCNGFERWKAVPMSKNEIERLYKDTWRKYDQGLIGSNIIRQQVEYCAELMKAFDCTRAVEMRDSVQGY